MLTSNHDATARLIWLVLASIHLLASAAWFGAMAYSLFVVHPRARKFFAGDDAKFEEMIATFAQGARWKVLSLLATIGVSGVAMAGGFYEPTLLPAWWIWMIRIKAILLLVAVGLFCHVSWQLWPRRIFAAEGELAAMRGRFRFIAIMLVAIAAVASVLGVCVDWP